MVKRSPSPVTSRFSNRSLYGTPGLWKRALRNRHYSGPLHLAFEVGGRSVVYAYIRKNACTSFKKFLLVRAGITELPEGTSAIRVLSDQFRAEYLRDFVEADRTLFVHRDPIDRAVSLYKNKFVQSREAVDIHRDYEEVLGEPAAEATFRAFVLRYLPRAGDPHTRSQRSHLYPSVYTDAVPIESLNDALRDILSPEIVDEYFARPANVSGDETYDEPTAPTIGAHELKAELDRTGLYPSRESLVPSGGGLHQSLLRRYADDLIFSRS